MNASWGFWVGTIVAAIALAVALYTMLRYRGMPLSQEQMLEQKVRELENTVKVLQRHSTQDAARISELERMTQEQAERIHFLEAELARYQAPKNANNTLLVGIGDDPLLRADLAALRGVERVVRPRLNISRRMPVTKDNLKRALDTARRKGKPIRYLHLAVHSSDAGLEFGDGLADADWLSENLDGVEIAVLAGCKNEAVGDLLGVVPAVVTMNEEIENNDAWQFAEVFWRAIGEGKSVEAAWELCEERCPAGMMEFAQLRT